MSEMFSWKKLFLSPFTSLYWTKTIMFVMGGCVLFFVSYGLYKAYFRKPDPAQTIRVGKESNVTIIQRNDAKKKFIPFIEAYAGQESDHKMNTGIRGGLRFEF